MPTYWNKQGHRAQVVGEDGELEAGGDTHTDGAYDTSHQAPQRKGPSLKNRALRLLTNREHSRGELERKLGPHEETPGQLAQVLDELAAKGFISHERVVASVVYRRASKVGVRVVAQELQQKGIAPDEMQEAMAELKTTELERARAVWAKKFGEVALSPQEKVKQLRFLANRGFGAEVLYKVVGELDDYE